MCFTDTAEKPEGPDSDSAPGKGFFCIKLKNVPAKTSEQHHQSGKLAD